jgi:hypothetical protein
VVFSQLEIFDLDGYELRSAQAATKEHGEDGMVAQVSQLLSRVCSEQFLALFSSQPIPNTNA